MSLWWRNYTFVQKLFTEFTAAFYLGVFSNQWKLKVQLLVPWRGSNFFDVKRENKVGDFTPRSWGGPSLTIQTQLSTHSTTVLCPSSLHVPCHTSIPFLLWLVLKSRALSCSYVLCRAPWLAWLEEGLRPALDFTWEDHCHGHCPSCLWHYPLRKQVITIMI